LSNEVSTDEALLKRYRKEIMDLKKQLEEVSLETRAQAMEKDQLEKERDFYFGKLRNIELICQENEGENDPVLQRIVDILYATDEGFVIPD
uniref:Chimera protein of Centromere-associated protein E and Microtubule-associated protein RP/EB family member 1 n=1 Tax=Homo sapiens TaxID=9606 RepID=UPI0008141F45